MPPKKQEETPEIKEAVVPSVAPTLPESASKDEQIAELRAKLDSVLGFIEGQQKSAQPKRVVEHTARVLFIEDRAVIEFGQAEVKKVDGKEVMMVPITLQDKEGKKETVEANWLNVLNESPRFLCEIVKQQAEKKVKPQELVPRMHKTVVADPMGARMGGSGFQSREILLEHTQVFYKSDVKFLEGPWKDLEVTLPNEAFNH